MYVKICGITNAKDALFAVAMGADAIGFVLAASKRQVDPEALRMMTLELPTDVVTVGVFRNEVPGRILEIVELAGLRGVQLHGQETPADVALLRRRVPFLVQAFTVDDPRLERLDEYDVDAILLDSPSPGSGETFDWSGIGSLVESRRVILAGGLDSESVAMAIETVRPWGVDVASGVESSSGVKDPVMVRRFIANARTALSEFPPDVRPT